MFTHKTLTLSVLAIAGCSIVFIIGTQYSSGYTSIQPSASKIKVLRRKDQLAVKPSLRELQDILPGTQSEREIENQIPTHLPIKAKLKPEKEKAFKDLNNDKWARDLEIEVKNIGRRPIYYLVLAIDLPELVDGSSNVILPLRFGDKRFANFASGAQPGDLSIKPGEVVTLRIKQGASLDWDDLRRGHDWPKPKRFVLEFQELSYADGTGFIGRDGAPWELGEKQPGAVLKSTKKPLSNGHHASTFHWEPWERASNPVSGGEPACLVPARFLSASASPSLLDASLILDPIPECGCTGDRCRFVYVYDDFTSCYGNPCDAIRQADEVLCTNSRESASSSTLSQCHVWLSKMDTVTRTTALMPMSFLARQRHLPLQHRHPHQLQRLKTAIPTLGRIQIVVAKIFLGSVTPGYVIVMMAVSLPTTRHSHKLAAATLQRASTAGIIVVAA
jgi:hypothetical protein